MEDKKRPFGSYTGGYNNSKQAADPVKRKHAGDTKVGLPLIMPGGRQRWDSFHYNFTDLGKFKKQPRPGEVEVRVKETAQIRDMAEKIKYALPRNFCPDCNQTDRAHEQGALNVWMMQEEHQDLDLKPGEIVVTFWCQPCQMHGLYGKQIKIPDTGDIPGLVEPEKMDEHRKAMIRRNRMDRNIAQFIRNRLTANDFSIIVKEEDKKLAERG